jgi:hypothetical protein
VLAEEALGGPTALVATPFQKVAGTAARAVNAPVRFVANTVDRAVDGLSHVGAEAGDGARGVAGRAAALSDAVRETLAAGRAASLRRAERIARRDGTTDAADVVQH